ncbi:TetR/AcrR family transcriptional regulator [Nocardia seriolae]|uniref:TetR/AcrR family transcriptional regulator n=1 Tax=Nocardia seriolae TaxID=37332 RepID=UPI003F833070
MRALALYYYFSSREELIGEVMVVGQRWVRTHVAAALDRLPPGTAPLDRVAAAVDAHLRVELELSEFARAVTRNSGQLPADLRAPVAAESAQYHALWRELLEAGRADGSIRADLDLRTARMLVIGALNWAAEWWDGERGSIDGGDRHRAHPGAARSRRAGQRRPPLTRARNRLRTAMNQ